MVYILLYRFYMAKMILLIVPILIMGVAAAYFDLFK